MFQEIFECSPLALILVDSQGKMKYVNREAERLFGYSKEDMQNHELEMLVPHESRDRHPKLRSEFFKKPLSRSMGMGRDLFGVRRDGTKFPIEVGLNPIVSDGETFVVSSILDITSRVKAEEKFRTAVEAAPNGMIMVDEKGTIILANEQAEKMFGYMKTELLGNPIELLVPLETRGRHPTFVKSFMGSPVPRPMGVGRDLFARRKDGSQFPVEIGLRPFTGPDGVFVISSIVDITERVKDRQRLMSRNEELQQFSYRTSHDLKAPLISMRGLAEFILEDATEGNIAEVTKNAEKIITLSDKLKSLLEDILSLTKADYIEEPVTEVSIADVISTARLKFQGLSRNPNFEIREVLAHSKPLKSQGLLITQILDNLLSNAIKYGDLKKEIQIVCVRTYSDDHHFYIQVEDNGLGIPADKQSEVFGMFKRFHRENTDGSGLGLYLVKKLVQKLNGSITFESSPEKTVFFITLPNR